MNLFVSPFFQSILTAGYVSLILCLCFLLLLVSNFYRRKFDNPSPRFGFYIGIAAGLLFLGMLLSGASPSHGRQVFQSFCLMACAGGSVIGTIQLYVTMKKVNK